MQSRFSESLRFGKRGVDGDRAMTQPGIKFLVK
jgi:hypothetical protein